MEEQGNFYCRCCMIFHRLNNTVVAHESAFGDIFMGNPLQYFQNQNIFLENIQIDVPEPQDQPHYQEEENSVHENEGEIDDGVEQNEDEDSFADLNAFDIDEEVLDEFNLLEDEDNSVDDQDCDYSAILFEGSSNTLFYVMYLLIVWVIRFKISITAFKSLLNILFYILPEKHKLPCTWYKFKKFFNQFNKNMKKVHVCPNEDYFYREKMDDNLTHCPVCNESRYKTNSKNVPRSYVYALNLRKELKKRILNDPDFLDKIQYPSRRIVVEEEICDVWDGKKLKASLDAADRGHIQLEFGLCTDGVSPFNSSTLSLWPFYLINYCLDPFLRASPLNMLVAVLWFGHGKPTNVDLCFDIIISYVFGTLLTEGKLIKARICFSNFDLDGRAMVTRMTSYRGYYGCHYCEVEGVYSDSHTYYPVGVGIERTKESYLDCALAIFVPMPNVIVSVNAKAKRDLKKGVKGPASHLVKLPGFNIIDDTLTDIMHQLMNFLPLLLTRWSGKEFKDKPYYIGKQGIIDYERRIRILRCPHDYGRKPRSLDSVNRWKAEEYKKMAFYLLDLLFSGIQKEIYLAPVRNLFSQVMKLTCPGILKEKLGEIGETIFNSITSLQRQYGVGIMTLNTHNFLHLEEIVRHSGPLSNNWLFPFENLGGVLKGYLHGTSNGFDSMIDIFQMSTALPEIESKLPDEQSIINCLAEMNYKFDEPQTQGLQIIGKSKIIRCPDVITDLVPPNVQIYRCDRIRYNNVMFHSLTYSRRGGSASYYACTEWNCEDTWDCIFFEIQYYVHWKFENELNCYAVVRKLPKIGVLNNSKLPVLSTPQLVHFPIHYSQIYSKFILAMADLPLRNLVAEHNINFAIAKPLNKALYS